MLEGKELILATKPFAKESKALSWLYTISTAIIWLTLLFFTYYAPNLFLRFLSSVVCGLVMIRLFVIYHDHQHHAILHKSPLANFFFTIYGAYMMAPNSIWKRSHDFHHANNSKLFSASVGSFPIMTKEKFLDASKEEQRVYLFTRHPITIIFGFLTMFVYGMCIQSFLSSPRRHYDSLISLIVHITIAVLIIVYAGWIAWFLTWFLPFSIACGMGAYLFYAQHNFPGVKFKNNVEWSYEHAALESSSFMKMNPLMHWFTANIGYHHIHHINARIPFYRLPEAMKAIPELQQYKTTSFKLRDVIACFKLKVWDPEAQKMVGL